MVHMTNLASCKVVAGKVSSIIPYAGRPPTLSPIADDMPKPFNLYGLIVSNGIGIVQLGPRQVSQFYRALQSYDLG